MLPIIVLTVAYFFTTIESSPVYNMQPAYITANIGTTGRNIRNLPCISRKNSLSGVCMFAIDCFKANGTHLGTCIDRFYFGSCCHIESISNDIDNNIELALFPDKHRDPPLKLDTTEKLDGETSLATTINPEKYTQTSTNLANISTSVSSSTLQELRQKPTQKTTTKPTAKITTTTSPTPPTTITTSTTTTPITTTTPTTTVTPSTIIPTTTLITTSTKKITTPTPTSTTTTPTRKTTPIIITTNKRTEPTSKIPIIITKDPITELNEFKLTTFQSVDNEIQTTLKPFVTFSKPTVSSLIYKPTKRPTVHVNVVTEETKEPITVSVPLVTRPSSPSSRPELIKVTTKPTKSSRPTKPNSIKPTRTKPSRPTQKPITRPSSKPTRKVTTTTKPIKIVTKISTVKTEVEKLTTTRPELIETKRPSSTTIITTMKPIVTESPPRFTLSDELQAPAINASNSFQITSPDSTSSNNTQSSTISIQTTQNTSSSSKQPVTTTVTTPSITLSASTTKPITSEPVTNKPITTINATTHKPSISTTEQLPILLTTQNPIGLFPMEEGLKVPEMATTTESNDILTMNLTSISSEGVNGNTATNEIESIKPIIEPTTKPSLVTWTGSVEEPIINGTDGDWVPMTTPDGWVMLPSVSSVEEHSSQSSNGTSTTTKLPLIHGETTSTTDHIAPSEASSGIYNVSTSEEGSTTIDSTNQVEEPTFNMSNYRDVCGRRIYPEARIVGGDNSSFGKWPWQISLRQWRTSTYLHKCGAALLSEYWAITAAHCVERVPPSDLLLRLGEYDLANELEPYVHQERRIQIVASHPQFDPRTFEYDLSLLRFYEPVKFQPNILPVCVPQNDDDFIGTNAYVTGWGRLYEDGPLPNILQEVRVPVINNTLCESMYRSAGYIEHIPHIFICAGWGRGGYDSCEGDSGGPMVIQREDKRFLLAGVISWGIGCAEPNQPGVYTRISEFREWINQILQF
ncbi:serine proteinase stubble [Onthophagus taurus]|uniref:serine proteinase stubble n=1 Tax=Onthophagus taurus TaxID=166361 RepID=UPI0039BDC559